MKEKRNFFLAIIGILIILLIFSLFSDYKEHVYEERKVLYEDESVEVANQENRPKSCNSNIKEVVSEEGMIAVTYERPSWLTGHVKQCDIEQYIYAQYAEIKKSADDLLAEFPDSALLPFRLNIKIKQYVVDPYESIIIENWHYTGGAHGNVAYKYYNLKEKSDISFEKYLNDIRYDKQNLLQQVNKQLEEDGNDMIEKFESEYEDQEVSFPWHIHQREDESLGITFIFPPYFVASYAAGTIVYSF